MSDSPTPNRIQCPGCNARLVVPSQNVSPYIRCGVCQVLIEYRVDNPGLEKSTQEKSLQESDWAYSAAENESRKTVRHVVDSSPYENSPEVDILRVSGGNRNQQSSGPVALAMILLAVGFLLFIGYLNTATIPKPQPIRTSFRIDPKVDLQKYLDDYRKRRSNNVPSIEINLNGQSPKSFDANTTKVTLDGKNFTGTQISELARLPRLTRIGYSNVQIQPEDLHLLRRKNLTELDLSHSKWKRGQLLFNGDYYPNLQKLDLSFSSVGGFEISGLNDCRLLTSLNLRGTSISDNDLDAIRSHPSLESLDLTNTDITFEGLKRLRCRNLNFLLLAEGLLSTDELESIREHFNGCSVLVVSNVD